MCVKRLVFINSVWYGMYVTFVFCDSAVSGIVSVITSFVFCDSVCCVCVLGVWCCVTVFGVVCALRVW